MVVPTVDPPTGGVVTWSNSGPEDESGVWGTRRCGMSVGALGRGRIPQPLHAPVSGMPFATGAWPQTLSLVARRAAYITPRLLSIFPDPPRPARMWIVILLRLNVCRIAGRQLYTLYMLNLLMPLCFTAGSWAGPGLVTRMRHGCPVTGMLFLISLNPWDESAPVKRGQ